MATAERDLYKVLGVPREATDAEIKRAFRKLAQQWHPDVNKDPEAPARFKEASEAYQILSDPERRQRYDMFGRAGVDGGPAGAGFEGFGGFSDIFDAFFGGAATGSARRGRPQPCSDLRYDLRITFEEAVKGTEKEIEFRSLARCDTCAGTGAAPGTQPTTCPQCEGRGEIRSVRQTMLGQMVNVSACPRCRGEGKIGPRGGPSGSLYVAVHIAPHPSLRREGTELYHEARISIAQAALGTTITVPTVDGEEEVEIKPGTQPDTAIRLRGKGVPHLRRAGSRGDLHVLVDVEVPRKLTKKQRDLLEQFARESGHSVSTDKGGILDKLGLG